MYGNLQAFAGHDAFNEYAEHLRTFGQPMLPHEGLLWIIRVVLVVSLVVHVYAAVVLWRRARAARTVQYEVKKHTGAIVASRLMRWGGVTILVFLVWHLLNFTIGKVNVSGGPTDDPYNLLVDTFAVWWLTLIYLVAMAMLGAHLHHGIWSAAADARPHQPRTVAVGGPPGRLHHGRDHHRRLLPGADLRPRGRHREVGHQ